MKLLEESLGAVNNYHKLLINKAPNEVDPEYWQ